MLSIVFALSAAAPSAIDAERAFAKMAQDKGQWTAFRATAAPDAMMFVPQPIRAHDFLKDRKDPAKAVRWWPIQSWQSCDGTLAVNTGGAVWPGGEFTRFTTVWARQPDSTLKWIYDNGEDVTTRPPEPAPTSTKASCKGRAPMRLVAPMQGARQQSGQSKDGSLVYDWIVDPAGAHRLSVSLWNGAARQSVHTLAIPAPAKP